MTTESIIEILNSIESTDKHRVRFDSVKKDIENEGIDILELPLYTFCFVKKKSITDTYGIMDLFESSSNAFHLHGFPSEPAKELLVILFTYISNKKEIDNNYIMQCFY